MASTHSLDVSMALDDLGWHFYNHYHRGFAEETLKGLKELEANEIAYIFEHAYNLVEPHWDEIGIIKNHGSNFGKWCIESGLDSKIAPLNSQLWNIIERWPDYGILHYWLVYARKYPDRL